MARPREFDEQQAVDQALETFWSGSFATTSTEDLCAATGLSRSSLYNTFQTKAALYERSLERYTEVTRAERADYLERDGTGREVLEALLLDVLGAQCGRPGRRVCLVVQAAVEVGECDGEVADAARRNLGETSELLRQLIVRGQQDGSITTPSPAADLAVLIHAALNGLQVRARVTEDTAGLRRSVHTLLALL